MNHRPPFHEHYFQSSAQGNFASSGPVQELNYNPLFTRPQPRPLLLINRPQLPGLAQPPQPYQGGRPIGLFPDFSYQYPNVAPSFGCHDQALSDSGTFHRFTGEPAVWSQNPVCDPYDGKRLDLDSTKGWRDFVEKQQEIQHSIQAEPPLKHCDFQSSQKVLDLSNQCKKAELLKRKLNMILQAMSAQKATASEEEWVKLVAESQNLQVELGETLVNIKGQTDFRKIRFDVKKRQWKKRRNAVNAEAKKRQRKEWEDKERSIDQKRKKSQEDLQKKKEDEETKKAADAVLSEVKGKLSEAKHMLDVLETISRLRKAKVDAAVASGQRGKEAECDEVFARKKASLQELMLRQLADYQKEEAALKVMLQPPDEIPTAKRSPLLGKSQKEVLEIILFGNRRSDKHESIEVPQTLEELVARRHEWDYYLSQPGTPFASGVPPSWVYPTKPSSEDWAKFLVETS